MYLRLIKLHPLTVKTNTGGLLGFTALSFLIHRRLLTKSVRPLLGWNLPEKLLAYCHPSVELLLGFYMILQDLKRI